MNKKRIIRLKEAGEILSVSHQTVRNWIASGHLPEPIQLGPRARGWLEEDFTQAIAAKKQSQS